MRFPILTNLKQKSWEWKPKKEYRTNIGVKLAKNTVHFWVPKTLVSIIVSWSGLFAKVDF